MRTPLLISTQLEEFKVLRHPGGVLALAVLYVASNGIKDRCVLA